MRVTESRSRRIKAGQEGLQQVDLGMESHSTSEATGSKYCYTVSVPGLAGIGWDGVEGNLL